MYMYMIFHVDDWCWFMLDLSLNEVTMKYMPSNLDIYAKSMIYVEYNLMNMRIWYGIPAVHIRISILYMFHVGSLWWFMIDMMLYDDLCL